MDSLYSFRLSTPSNLMTGCLNSGYIFKFQKFLAEERGGVLFFSERGEGEVIRDERAKK
jgi:hypothetical protein